MCVEIGASSVMKPSRTVCVACRVVANAKAVSAYPSHSDGQPCSSVMQMTHQKPGFLSLEAKAANLQILRPLHSSSEAKAKSLLCRRTAVSPYEALKNLVHISL